MENAKRLREMNFLDDGCTPIVAREAKRRWPVVVDRLMIWIRKK
jgi:hypothetical protein